MTAGSKTLFRIADLNPHPQNPNRHSPQEVALIRQSLRKFGVYKPLVVWFNPEDKRWYTLTGHCVAEAAAQEGMGEVWVEDRSDLSSTQALALMAGDNEIARQLSYPDQDDLSQLIAAVHAEDESLAALAAGGEDELRRLLEMAGQEPMGAPEAQIDKAAELQEIWQVKVGDLWQCGKHLIVCGRCNDADTIARLNLEEDRIVVTDPPYCSGGSQEAQKKQGTWGEIDSDNLSTRGYQSLIRSMIQLSTARAYYVFTDWRMWITLYDLVESEGHPVRSMIVWAKDSPAMGGIWRTQHELILFASQQNQAKRDGIGAIGNVLTARRTGNRYHFTEKPIELLEQIIKNDAVCVGREKSIVLDPFLGSGTTLVACQKLGRRGRGVEIVPQYVAVCCQRLQDMGLEVKRVE